MIRGKNIIITMMMSAFLLASASAFADYSQKQNKVDDKMNSPQQSQSGSSMKSDDKMGGQGSSDKSSKDSPRGDAAEKNTGQCKSK